jgi:hypothetical protein
MKITKTRLKQIIKEELENIQEMDNITTSKLMQTALSNNEIPSLSSLIQLKPQYAKLITDLNDVAENLKPNMGNKMALSLAITNLKKDKSEPAAAERFLEKNKEKHEFK